MIKIALFFSNNSVKIRS